VGWTDGFPRSFWLAEALITGAILGGDYDWAATDWVCDRVAQPPIAARRCCMEQAAREAHGASGATEATAGVVPVGFRR
jgi:hypothetical protein